MVSDFTLSAYIEGIRQKWQERDIQRNIVCGLPRGSMVGAQRNSGRRWLKGYR